MDDDTLIMRWKSPPEFGVVAGASGPAANDAAADTASEEGKLLLAARRGDEAAFDALLRRHDRAVLGFARRLLGRPEDAQEAAQEAFLRLFRNLHSIDPERSLRAWLYRVTANVCHDLRHKQGRHRGDDLDTAEAAGQLPAASRSDDPEAWAEGRQEAAIVEKALATLGPNERSALVLRDIEGLDTHEVARILGSSPATVRSQICKARLKIHRFRQRWSGQAPAERSR